MYTLLSIFQYVILSDIFFFMGKKLKRSALKKLSLMASPLIFKAM